MNHVLNPSEVRISTRRRPVSPTLIVSQQLAAPIRHIERRIGEDVVSSQIRVSIVVERVTLFDWPSIPLIAKFIFAKRHVVGFDS